MPYQSFRGYGTSCSVDYWHDVAGTHVIEARFGEDKDEARVTVT